MFVPHNEPARLAYLASLDLMDTPPDSDFDDLAALASQICQTPVSLITMINAERQFFKARVGVQTTGTDRGSAFCTHTIRQRPLKKSRTRSRCSGGTSWVLKVVPVSEPLARRAESGLHGLACIPALGSARRLPFAVS